MYCIKLATELFREMYVKYNEQRCVYLQIISGIPQGSILGHLLFLFYVIYICNISYIVNFILFADNTTILITIEIQH